MIPRFLAILVFLTGSCFLAAGKPRDIAIFIKFPKQLEDREFEEDIQVYRNAVPAYLSHLSRSCISCNGRPQGDNRNKKKDKNGFHPSPERYTYFDTDILETVVRKETGNVALSPIAIKLILGMLLEGSKGNTAFEIQDALRLPNDMVEARKVVNGWMKPFQGKGVHTDTKLSLATQLFLLNDYKVNSSYAEILEKQFNGGITNLPNEIDYVAERINEWATKETKGLIPEIVTPSQLAGDVKAILASALYFKAPWKYTFIHAPTRCFYKKPRTCVKSIYMQRTEEYRYGYSSTLDAQVLELPYKEERFSMVIVLPRATSNHFGHDFFRENLQRIVSNLKLSSVSVQIPRFIINFNIDLVDALVRSGVSEAFGAGADLSGIFEDSNDKVSVSDLFHSVKLVIDEQGSEGAAATFVSIVPLMAESESKTTFIADGPFYFFIWDSITNVTIFAGRVTDPEVAADNNMANINIYGETFLTKQEAPPRVAMKPGRPIIPVNTPKADINTVGEMLLAESFPTTTFKPRTTLITTKSPPIYNDPSPNFPSPSPLKVMRTSTSSPLEEKQPFIRTYPTLNRRPSSETVQFPQSDSQPKRRNNPEIIQVRENASSNNSNRASILFV